MTVSLSGLTNGSDLHPHDSHTPAPSSASSSSRHHNGWASPASRENRWKILKEAELFSVYAMGAASGELRWRHDGEFDAAPEKSGAVGGMCVPIRPELSLSPIKLHLTILTATGGSEDQHTYTTRLEGSAHEAAADWREFRASLLKSLPHHWESRHDTRLHAAHFQRQRARRRFKYFASAR